MGVRLKIQIQEAKLKWRPLLKVLHRAEVKGVKPRYGVRDSWLVTHFGDFWMQFRDRVQENASGYQIRAGS